MKTFIFDLDGTVVNTLDDIAYNVNLMLDHFGFKQHSVEDIRMMVGNGARKLVTRALPEDKRYDDFVEQALDVYQKFYDNNLVLKTFIYEGLENVLIELKDRGCHLAVLSNKDHRHVVEVVNALLPNVFDIVKGFDGTYPHKPSPEAVLSIIKELNAELADVAFVGDSSVDIQTAKNTNVKAVGVAWGFWGEKSFDDCEPDVLIHTPEELLNV